MPFAMALPRLVRRLIGVWVFFVLFALALLIVAYLAPKPTTDDRPFLTLRGPTGAVVTMDVDIADTDDEWRRGLQNRPVVARPMLFVFPDEAIRTFWMKDTLVPLDISYFRGDGTWVSSAHMEPCVADPCATYPSAAPARYALEIPAPPDVRVGSGWVIVPLER